MTPLDSLDLQQAIKSPNLLIAAMEQTCTPESVNKNDLEKGRYFDANTTKKLKEITQLLLTKTINEFNEFETQLLLASLEGIKQLIEHSFLPSAFENIDPEKNISTSAIEQAKEDIQRFLDESKSPEGEINSFIIEIPKKLLTTIRALLCELSPELHKHIIELSEEARLKKILPETQTKLYDPEKEVKEAAFMDELCAAMPEELAQALENVVMPSEFFLTLTHDEFFYYACNKAGIFQNQKSDIVLSMPLVRANQAFFAKERQ